MSEKQRDLISKLEQEKVWALPLAQSLTAQGMIVDTPKILSSFINMLINGDYMAMVSDKRLVYNNDFMRRMGVFRCRLRECENIGWCARPNVARLLNKFFEEMSITARVALRDLTAKERAECQCLTDLEKAELEAAGISIR